MKRAPMASDDGCSPIVELSRRSAGRRGVLIYLLVGMIFVLCILGYALFSQMQDEYRRIHRIYYGTAAIKVAEAVEAEAFSWFAWQLSLPRARQHPFVRALFERPTSEISVRTGEEPSTPDSRYLDLLAEGLVPHAVDLASSLGGGGAVIRRATLAYKDLLPLYSAAGGTSDPRSSCVISPDPFERYGSVELTVDVAYGRVKRGLLSGSELIKRYVSRRDVRVVNVLPPVVGKFTLFVRSGWRCGTSLSFPASPDEPYNACTAVSPYSAGLYGATDFTRAQPLVLIHHPEDIKTRRGYCVHYADMVKYLPWEPPFDGTTCADEVSAVVSYRPDLLRRGWVFLGGTRGGGVIRPWYVNLQAGQASSAAGGDIPDYYDLSFCASMTLEGFLFHESYRTATHTQIVGLPGAAGWAPATDFGLMGRVADYRFALYHYGYVADVLPQEMFCKGVFGNYFASHPSESLLPSLLRLYGDVQIMSLDSAKHPDVYCDRRSPTLVLGPVVRRLVQATLVMQDDPSRTFPYPKEAAPTMQFLPFFDIRADGTYAPGSDPLFSWNTAEWRPSGLAGVPDFNVVDDTFTGRPRPPALSVPAVRYRQREDVFHFDSGDPYKLYGFLMCKILKQPVNDGYDWIVENSNPTAGLDPRRHLKQEHLKVLRPADGSAVDDRYFFYNTTDPSKGLCYYAANLAAWQYDDSSDEPVVYESLFPDGKWKGALGALQLYDTAQLPGNFSEGELAEFTSYDVRQKTSYRFADQDAFKRVYIDGSGDVRIEKPFGVSLIADGALDLTRGDDGPIGSITFDEGGMIIVKGDVVLPSVLKSQRARSRGETLTFVSLDGDIILAGERVEAGLVALGAGHTVRKSPALPSICVFGIMAVDVLDFSTDDDTCIFSGTTNWSERVQVGGSPAYRRSVVIYDPSFDPLASGNYMRHYKAFTAGGVSYWKTREL